MMRVVFGWNNFLIKSFNPFKLGLTKNPNLEYTVELRQNYFHFFWIPFFGIGKKWFLRKGDELYDTPSEFNDILENYKAHFKTPWYTFSGIIIIFSAYAGYIGHKEYKNYKTYQYDLLWIEQKANKINYPKIDDQYKLITSDGCFIMKIVKIKEDSLLFSVPEVRDQNEHYKSNNNDVKNTIFVWLTKNKLLECCAKKPEDFYNFKGQHIKNLYFLSNEKFYLDRVDREDPTYLDSSLLK